MEFFAWVRSNWFDFLQSFGIIASLLFTAVALGIDAKVRRIDNLFEVTKQHREIWTTLYSRPDLKRIVDATADVAAKPITDEEELFINLLILHLASNYRAARAGMFTLPIEIKADIKAFFSLPVPAAVWQKLKSFQDRAFVAFVEGFRDGD